jgi:hypothetical protein
LCRNPCEVKQAGADDFHVPLLKFLANLIARLCACFAYDGSTPPRMSRNFRDDRYRAVEEQMAILGTNSHQITSFLQKYWSGR